jgi:sugar O-acyltransferase (sialic acid O-acetyltransferase NeuD family)
MQDLLIFPYNGNGLEALDCLGNTFNFIGFVDDTIEKQGTNKFGHKVFDRTAFSIFPDAKVLAVPGSPSSYLFRKEVINSLNINQDRYATVIHPDASISKNAKIGNNCLIYAGVVITSNAELGSHICILPNSVIHHDVSIDDYTLIGASVCIAGGTRVGKNCYIGSGSNVINSIEIGNNVLVGMGSNVLKNVEENSKIAGNPAKVL